MFSKKIEFDVNPLLLQAIVHVLVEAPLGLTSRKNSLIVTGCPTCTGMLRVSFEFSSEEQSDCNFCFDYYTEWLKKLLETTEMGSLV